MAIVDLNQLAAPDVVEELDYETILRERKATLVSLYPKDQQDAIVRTLTLKSELLVKLLQEKAKARYRRAGLDNQPGGA